MGMERTMVCSLDIQRRHFGSSYHDYPPLAGSHISNYFWRAPIVSEASDTTKSKMIADINKYNLTDPFFGKSLRLLGRTRTKKMCTNHHRCKECATVDMHVCSLF